MARLVLGIAAIIACFMLGYSLECNKCGASLLGFCFNSGTEVCSANVTSCYTGEATFPSISSFNGFNNQGCQTNTTACNTTMTSSLVGVEYQVKVICCESDKCNPVDLTGDAPATKLTFTAAIAAALLASMLTSLQ